ncbi:MAG: hypothetical protein ABIE23_00885 [archaeon]
MQSLTKISWKINLLSFPFTIARLVPYIFFGIFSVMVFFVFSFAASLFPFPIKELIYLAQFIVFLDYWIMFRKNVIYPLRASHIAIITEILKGEKGASVQTREQLSRGLWRVKEKFGSLTKLRKFERRIELIEKKILEKVYWLQLIPNLLSSINELLLSYILFNNDFDLMASTRDGLILLQQKNRQIVFKSTVIVVISLLLLFIATVAAFFLLPLISPFFRSLDPVFLFPSLLVFWLIVYEYFSPFLLVKRVLTFLDTVKDDSPSKTTRNYLEGVSPEFNLVSSEARTFFPIKSVSNRNLIKYFELEREKELEKEQTEKAKEIKKAIPMEKLINKFKEEAKKTRDIEFREEVRSRSIQEILAPKIEKMRRAMEASLEKPKQELSEEEKIKIKTFRIIDRLLDQLIQGLGSDKKIEVRDIKKKERGWKAMAKVDTYLFEFGLDEDGRVLSFTEILERKN